MNSVSAYAARSACSAASRAFFVIRGRLGVLGEPARDVVCGSIPLAGSDSTSSESLSTALTARLGVVGALRVLTLEGTAGVDAPGAFFLRSGVLAALGSFLGIAKDCK